jgi:UDP-N-acetylmuramoyl-L-alanyl-D-glutamate--2,6-diaminopimelate ligase
MAASASMYADKLIITSDNPRNENPDDIIKDILAGVDLKTSCDVITDRKEAIFSAIRHAQKGDVIVLAGKGHEDYQVLADDVHIHFDEREIVAEALKQI